MTLRELSEKTGITLRTIRFYISKGLMEGPVGQGRAAYYNDSHLKTLRRITDLKESGKVISEIKREIYPAEVEVTQPQAIWSYQISNDVTVQVKADASPWRARRIQRALRELSQVLAEEEKEES
jgi:DNA-binding transcriptional MerR regulator